MANSKVARLEGTAPKPLPQREVVSVESSTLFRAGSFERWNPDMLAARKGGLGIYARMMVDEQVKAVMQFKQLSIIGRGHQFVFEETKLSDDEKKRRTNVMEAMTRKMRGSFTDALLGILRGQQFGYSMTEIVTDIINVDGASYIGINQLLPRDVSTFQFYTDDYGQLLRLTQRANSYRETELDYAKFVHYVQNPAEDAYYGQSELRAAYRAWFMKDTAIKFWMQWLERMAGGFGIVKLGNSGITPNSPDYIALQSMLQNMRSMMGAMLPNGVEMEVVSPTTTDAYQKAVEFHDLAIAKSLLIPNLLGLSNSGQTGAYAQSQTQLEVYFMTIAADSARLEQTINDQLFAPIAKQNWDDGEFPRFKFNKISSEQLKWIVDTFLKMTGADAAVITEQDEAWLRKLIDAPARTEESVPLVTPQQEAQRLAEEALRQSQPQSGNNFSEEDAEPLTFGDLPGHEFRGNQYTSGSGNAKAAKKASSMLERARLSPGGRDVTKTKATDVEGEAKDLHDAIRTDVISQLQGKGFRIISDRNLGSDSATETILEKSNKNGNFRYRVHGHSRKVDQNPHSTSLRNNRSEYVLYVDRSKFSETLEPKTYAHPVDALKDLVPGMTPEVESRLRAVCDEEVKEPETKVKFSVAKYRAESRVDFSVIGQRTSALEADTVTAASRLLARAVRRLLNDEKLKELLDQDTADIGELKFDSADVGKIKAAFRSTLERAWAMGINQAMDETSKAKKLAYADDVRKLRFASLRDKASEYFDSVAFRMAGNLTDASRSIIQQELLNGVKSGKRPEDAASSIYDRLIRKGMTTLEAMELEESREEIRALTEELLQDALSTANVPAYLNTLARTNTFEALNEARYAEFTDPALADFVEALEYSAVLDDRTTDICTELDGHVHATGSKVWERYRPPNHYNCRSVLVAVTAVDGWDGEESDEPTVEPQDGFK